MTLKLILRPMTDINLAQVCFHINTSCFQIYALYTLDTLGILFATFYFYLFSHCSNNQTLPWGPGFRYSAALETSPQS